MGADISLIVDNTQITYKEFADDVLMEQESIHDKTKKVKDMIAGDFQISKFKRFAI